MRKQLTLFSVVALLLASTSLLQSCGGEEATDKTLKTERKEFTGELPDLSIYHLPDEWTNQDGEDYRLEDLRGDIVVAVMIYTTCKAACPRLVADMKNIHNQLSEEAKEQARFVFVSIDPETDTPEKMKAFSIENEMDNDNWIFLRGTEENTRTFATVLAVSYKRISPLDFSHSNIISVFDQDGVLSYQREGLDKDDSSIVEAINKLTL